MKVKAMCKGVGKYKSKFKVTGLLLDAGKGEFWADIKGELNYKDYKGNEVEVDIEKNPKGYWGGTLVGGVAAGGKGEDIRGKCLCQVITAGIMSQQLKCDNEQDIEHWTGYIMGREPAAEDAGPGPEQQQDDDIPF
ncbi:hypothetical protein LCGC14_1530530 [marine sediment metagenome]|uniref:Uncharacterized protein n=1 Tax=marine sediment metagenome TaxID=412755 RepID=A0A0F9JGU5_9ZZZZ